MITGEQLEALSAALDDGAVEQHAPVEIDGVQVGLTLRPADGDAIARALEELGKHDLGAIVRGGGNRLGFGHPPSRADAILSTERIVGVTEFEPGEGVCHVRGGTPLAEVRAAVNAGGWELPLDPPGVSSTVGGTLAAAAVGPRTLGFGLPRDLVLGLEVVLANGERTHCGGRVVKNVTGYDLNKLYTGSFGTLGVIEGAWLRLRPLPERVAVLELQLAEIDRACDCGLSAARRDSARATAILVEEDGPAGERRCRVAVEFAGDAASVERDAAWLVETCGAVEAAPDTLDRMKESQAEVPAPSGMRFRIAALPSRLKPAMSELAEAAAGTLCYPGLGLIYAGFPLGAGDEEAAVDGAFRRVDRIAREGGGGFICEAAPPWSKRGRDVFGALTVALPLIKTLKAGFDPKGVLNPGRFVGRV